jgi:glycosyltransferase involved in cell wall biosynthesis
LEKFSVTVVIPVYNVEKYIERAIESVLIQPEVSELILVDDGSSDNSLSICKKIQKEEPKIVILHHTGNKNKGVSASRNAGIKAAKNKFIAFLDSDDYYLSKRFSQTKLCFGKDTSIDGVYEQIGIYSDANKIKEYAKIEWIESGELFENLQPLGSRVWFSNNGITVKKEIFEKCGYFDETLKTSEDSLQWLKMAATCKLISGSTNDYVAMSYRRTNSLSSNEIQVHQDFISMFLKLFKFCTRNNISPIRKELVLKNLYSFISFNPYSNYFKGINRAQLYIKTLSIDPVFVLFQSKSFRISLINWIFK